MITSNNFRTAAKNQICFAVVLHALRLSKHCVLQILARQLAEVLLRGVCLTTYEQIDAARKPRSTSGLQPRIYDRDPPGRTYFFQPFQGFMK